MKAVSLKTRNVTSENAMEEIFFIIVKKYYLSRPVIELVYIVFWLSAKPI